VIKEIIVYSVGWILWKRSSDSSVRNCTEIFGEDTKINKKSVYGVRQYTHNNEVWGQRTSQAN